MAATGPVIRLQHESGPTADRISSSRLPGKEHITGSTARRPSASSSSGSPSESRRRLKLESFFPGEHSRGDAMPEAAGRIPEAGRTAKESAHRLGERSWLGGELAVAAHLGGPGFAGAPEAERHQHEQCASRNLAATRNHAGAVYHRSRSSRGNSAPGHSALACCEISAEADTPRGQMLDTGSAVCPASPLPSEVM